MRTRLFVALLGALAGAAGAQERVSIPSLDGTVQLVGHWFPAPQAKARPAVVDLHGCGGAYDAKGRLSPAYFRDALYFNREAMSVLVLDSFSPRGERSVCTVPHPQRKADEWMRARDVQAALQWLAGRPEVDAGRIALLGRSHGGSTVLAAMDAADSRFPLRPRAAVALYPGCGRFAGGYRPAAPLLVLIGADDDWTPAPRCEALRRRASPPFELVIYPGAHHGFDGTAKPTVRHGVQTKSGTATVAGHSEASAAAYRRLFEFLAAQLDAPLALPHEARFAPLRPSARAP